MPRAPLTEDEIYTRAYRISDGVHAAGERLSRLMSRLDDGCEGWTDLAQAGDLIRIAGRLLFEGIHGGLIPDPPDDYPGDRPGTDI